MSESSVENPPPRRTPFLEVLAGVRACSDEAIAFEVTADWAQNFTTVGGLTAAAAVHGLRRLVPDTEKLRAVHVQFLEALPPGTVTLRCRTLRRGAGTHVVEADAMADGQLAVRLTANFGRSRRSALTLPADGPPRWSRGLAELADEPFRPPLTPVFCQHFAFRRAVGADAFSGVAERNLGGYIRFAHEDGPGTEEAVLLMLDAWPPPTLAPLTKPAPAATIAWSVVFHECALDEARLGEWWPFESLGQSAHGGYTQGADTLWSPSGARVATAQQLITVFG